MTTGGCDHRSSLNLAQEFIAMNRKLKLPCEIMTSCIKLPQEAFNIYLNLPHRFIATKLPHEIMASCL